MSKHGGLPVRDCGHGILFILKSLTIKDGIVNVMKNIAEKEHSLWDSEGLGETQAGRRLPCVGLPEYSYLGPGTVFYLPLMQFGSLTPRPALIPITAALRFFFCCYMSALLLQSLKSKPAY